MTDRENGFAAQLDAWAKAQRMRAVEVQEVHAALWQRIYEESSMPAVGVAPNQNEREPLVVEWWWPMLQLAEWIQPERMAKSMNFCLPKHIAQYTGNFSQGGYFDGWSGRYVYPNAAAKLKRHV